MKAVQTTLSDTGDILEQELGNVCPSSFASVRASLSMYASRFFGKEGKDWKMVQPYSNRLYIIPFFVIGLGEYEGVEIHAK